MKIETRKGLWVSSSFTEKFGNGDITPAKTVPAFKTLERDMTNPEIGKELGVEECTLADIAAFLENPPQGTDDGYANLFYLAGYVVNVPWNADDQRWYVDAWKLDDGHWRAGRRAFSSATDIRSLGLDSTMTLEFFAMRLEKVEKLLKHYNLNSTESV